MALLAKQGIQLEILLNGLPTTVTYPPQPMYEEPLENHTQASELVRKVRNQQLKVTRRNRCKPIEEIGNLCGDKSWEHCDQTQSHFSTSLMGQSFAGISRSNTRISSLKRVDERTLARDGGVPHKNSEHNIRPFCFLCETTKKRICGGFPWKTH